VAALGKRQALAQGTPQLNLTHFERGKTMKKKFSVVVAIVAGAFLAGIAQSALAEQTPEQAAGEKLYKRERCETCHGPTAQGQGAFPSLVTSSKVLNKEEFEAIVKNGKTPMPSYSGNAKVMEGLENLRAYLVSIHK
jgi:mono/diheme cytochrome c family protein